MNRKTETEFAKHPPVREVEYVVDTISSGQDAKWDGHYNPMLNSITSNYYGTEKEKLHMECLLIHETKHKDNYHAGIDDYPMNKEQCGCMDSHDEISANLAELIYMRQKYIKTGNLSVFAEDEKFSFYRKQGLQLIFNEK